MTLALETSTPPATRIPFPRRSPAQPKPEPRAIDFDWRPQPKVRCLMQGEGTKGWVRVLVLSVDGDSAEVKIPGGKPVKVGVHRLRQWNKGEQEAKDIAIARAAPPARPDRVKEEPLYVMHKDTGDLLSRFTPNPAGSGWVLGWVRDLKESTPYATRNSAAISVNRMRAKGSPFEYTLCTKAQVESLHAIRNTPPAPIIPVEAPAPAVEPQPQAEVVAPAPELKPEPVTVVPVVTIDARIEKAQADVIAALDEQAAAYQIYLESRAKLRAAKNKLRFIEQSCACMRKQ